MGDVDPGQERRWLAAHREAVAAGRTPSPEVVAGIDALFGAAERRVRSACRRIVGDEEQARELAQEAMLTGYRKLAEFRGEGRLSTWLYGIAKGLALNAIRKQGELLSEDGVLESGDPALGALSGLRREEREALFREAVAELDAVEQEAIWLRYVEELPQDRITAILGLDEASGARGLLQRCRRRLEASLRAKLQARGHGSSFFRVTR